MFVFSKLNFSQVHSVKSVKTIIAPNEDKPKLATATTATFQFSLKLANISDEIRYKWVLFRSYSNGKKEMTHLTDGHLKQSDGWLTKEVSGFILPDFTGFDYVSIKVEGNPPVDFLIDNINLII